MRSKQDLFLTVLYLFLTEKETITTTTNNIQLPYLKDTPDSTVKNIQARKMDRTTTTLHKTNLQHRYKTGLILRGNSKKHQMDGERTRNKTRFQLGSRKISNRNHHQRRVQNRSRLHQHGDTNTAIQRQLPN